MIHGPMAVGIPAWATRADLEPDQTAVCELCGVEVDADNAVLGMGREFCSDDCLLDWAFEHTDETLKRLRD